MRAAVTRAVSSVAAISAADGAGTTHSARQLWSYRPASAKVGLRFGVRWAAAQAWREPSVSTIDLRPVGGCRHSVLTWPGTSEATEGAGRLVLFIHANSLCAGAWAPVVARLPTFTSVAIDQRGHGDSDAPEGAEHYSWDVIGQDFLRFVAHVTAAYGRPPDACVTHSFSGDCALLAMAKQHEVGGTFVKFPRLVLLDPVLADAEGADSGAKRLAKGTRRLGEKEADGFDSVEAVGEGLQRLLRGSLARADGCLDADAKAAFSQYGSAPDATGRWRLKCTRENEASVYEQRVALADTLADKHVDMDVQLVFAGRRRGRPEDQEAAMARDWREAERVVSRCRAGAVRRLDGVGHFLVLENPELVAKTLQELLSE